MKEIKKKSVNQFFSEIGKVSSAAIEATGGLLNNARPIFEIAKQHFEVSKEALKQDSDFTKEEINKNREYAAFAEEQLRNESLTDDDKKFWQDFYKRSFDNECDIRRESREFKMVFYKENKELVLVAFSILVGLISLAVGRQMPIKTK